MTRVHVQGHPSYHCGEGEGIEDKRGSVGAVTMWTLELCPVGGTWQQCGTGSRGTDPPPPHVPPEEDCSRGAGHIPRTPGGSRSPYAMGMQRWSALQVDSQVLALSRLVLEE